MKTKIVLNIGDKLYNTKTHRAWEVIKENSHCYYVAIFDGTCSKIDYISKTNSKLRPFESVWFTDKTKAIEKRVDEAKRMFLFEDVFEWIETLPNINPR